MRSLRASNGSPRSIFHQFIRFPLLRRPSFVNIPFWVIWWVCIHNGLRRSLGANNGSHRSAILLIFRTQRSLPFISGFSLAFWCSRRWRWWSLASRNQIHQWSWLCCDSSFTRFFLCPFRHHFKALCRTEIANVKQTQKMILFVTCEITLWSVCLRVVFGVNVFDLGFWGPNWFDQITNQEQLCGFWKHVSLSGFLPLWSSWSLLRCLHSNKYNKASWYDDWTCEEIKINVVQIIDHSSRQLTFLNCVRCWTNFTLVRTHVTWANDVLRRSLGANSGSLRSFLWSWVVFPGTETIRSTKSIAGKPSNLNPASREMISDSVELRETEVCLLHIQLIGTNV